MSLSASIPGESPRLARGSPPDRAPEPGRAEQTEVIAALDAEIARLPRPFARR